MSKRRGLGGTTPIAAALGRRKPAAKPRRTTIAISPEVAARVRDCASYERRTVVELTESVLLEAVAELEAAHGEGFVYPSARGKR